MDVENLLGDPAVAAMLALAATTLAFYVDPITLTAVPRVRAPTANLRLLLLRRVRRLQHLFRREGPPQNITVYRIAENVTGVSNKNTADPAGDISFVITKKNVTQTCLRTDCQGCHTDVEFLDLYLQAVIEFDGQWGPYQMCNPADGYDTTDWVCRQDCMDPTHHGCPPPRHGKKNGTECHFGGGDDCLTCWCERTAHTAGREAAPGPFEKPDGRRGLRAQCASSFNPWDSGCGASPLFGGKVYLNLTGWSFESVSAMACKRCHADDHCSGWVSHDNITAQLFSGATKSVTAAGCVGGKRFHNPWEKFGGSWFGIANLGDGFSSNIWYSTPDGAVQERRAARHRRLHVAAHREEIRQRHLRRREGGRGGRAAARRASTVPAPAQPQHRLLPRLLPQHAHGRCLAEHHTRAARHDRAVGRRLRVGRSRRGRLPARHADVGPFGAPVSRPF